MPRNKPWTDDENDKIISAYFELSKIIKSEGANLSKFIKNFIERENFTRSKGAVERKFANISAVLDEIGHEYISNFKPLPHYQSSMRKKVLERLNQDID